MQQIYGRHGRVIAWHNDGNIYAPNGAHLATIDGENVYGHGGQQLGAFRSGFFRDHSGGAVAFVEGASGGPLLPMQAISPIPPIPALAPIPAIPTIPRIPGIPSLAWGQDWDEFVRT